MEAFIGLIVFVLIGAASGGIKGALMGAMFDGVKKVQEKGSAKLAEMQEAEKARKEQDD